MVAGPFVRALAGGTRRQVLAAVASATFAAGAGAGTAACAQPASRAGRGGEPEALRVRVVRSLPHDREAFTQGLFFHAGKLYEGTGLLGRSSLRRVDPASGAVEAEARLDAHLFGEGIARVGGLVYQLTWQNRRALVWTLDGLRKQKEFRYDGEGWGLCFDGRHLVMSDGSDRLVRRDPGSFAVVGETRVRRAGKPLPHLNELEYADGAIYANVWQDTHIARIDPRTGEVTGWIDAGGLLDAALARGTDVLNGIAHVPGTRRFFITGKLWPRLFEVEFVPADPR